MYVQHVCRETGYIQVLTAMAQLDQYTVTSHAPTPWSKCPAGGGEWRGHAYRKGRGEGSKFLGKRLNLS